MIWISFFVLLIIIFFHSYYLFRRNVKFAPYCILFGIIFSVILFLLFYYLLERAGFFHYSMIENFAFFTIILSVFFLYLFYGLVAKDFYKKSRKTAALELIVESLKKTLPVFFSISLSLIILFSFTYILGWKFFVFFSLPVIIMILLSSFLSVFSSGMLCQFLYRKSK